MKQPTLGSRMFKDKIETWQLLSVYPTQTFVTCVDSD